MLIRDTQLQALEKAAAHHFENELVEHIKKFAPKHSETIRESGVRQVVHLGIQRGATYGFTNRGPLRFYVEMMFMFGSDFDTDLQLPWAGGVLNNEAISDQTERADILHDRLVEYVEQVCGRDNDYLLSALNRLNQVRIEDYSIARADFDNQIISTLRSIYPQKHDYLEAHQLLEALVYRGREMASSYSVTSAEGTALFVALMFAMGQGFPADPLFPWISKTLRDTSLDANQQAEQVYRKAKIYLQEALKYLEQSRKDV